MTRKDVTITSSKVCGQCGKKLYNGFTATAILNERKKIKAYTCSDNCADQYHSTATA